MAKTKPGGRIIDVSDKTLRELMTNIPELYRTAALVSYGIELSDLHVELILSGKMKYRDVIRELLCEPTQVRSMH